MMTNPYRMGFWPGRNQDIDGIPEKLGLAKFLYDPG
jgi:hypothetical protein